MTASTRTGAEPAAAWGTMVPSIGLPFTVRLTVLPGPLRVTVMS